jgi:hypothetical protein
MQVSLLFLFPVMIQCPGKDETGKPRKNLWPPPEGSAALPPEETNPLIKLLLDKLQT